MARNSVTSKKPCPKCGNKDFLMSEMFMHEGKGARFFNFPNRRLTTFTCAQCSYTELYNVPMSKASALIDHYFSS